MILKFGLRNIKFIPYTYTLFIMNKFHSKMILLCEGTKKKTERILHILIYRFSQA